MESKTQPDLGVCCLCGQAPDYNEKGHRGHEVQVLHDCPKLPGSPIVIFTVDGWVRGVNPYGAKSIKFPNDPDWIVGKKTERATGTEKKRVGAQGQRGTERTRGENTMNFTNQHRDRFLELLDALGCAANAKQRLWQDLEAAYQEPHRHYHTAQHIIECLELFDDYRAAEDGPYLPSKDVEAAVWWHDIVYHIAESKAISNEQLSAYYVYHVLRHYDPHNVFVRDYILSTDHTTTQPIPTVSFDAEFAVHDIDLAILGADLKRFAQYDDQIAQEYAHVPLAQYRYARARFLQSLLDRPRIYRTAYFYNRFEAKARANLTVLVEQLNIPLRRINEEEYRGAECIFVGKDVTIFHSRAGENVARSLGVKADGDLECIYKHTFNMRLLEEADGVLGCTDDGVVMLADKSIALTTGDHLYFKFFPRGKDNPMYQFVADLLTGAPNLRVVKDPYGAWMRAAKERTTP